MQLDLDDRLPDHLELDEPKISDGKGNRIVVGIGVAQRGKKLRRTGQYPSTLGTDQNCEMLHDVLLPFARAARFANGTSGSTNPG
jgi:hypothetical protein